MPSEEGFRGWVAGLLDIAGEIEINRRLPGIRDGVLDPAYSVSVQLSVADRRALEPIRAAYGGRITETKGRRRDYPLRLALGGEQAVQLLRDASPYLLLKREQAQACLDLADSMRQFRRYVGGVRKRVPESEQRRREELYRAVRETNGNGGG